MLSVFAHVDHVDEATFRRIYGPTFTDYLNRVVGERFDPPVSFELDYLNMLNFLNHVENRTIDYVIFTALHITCAELENRVIPLLSRLSGFEDRKYSEVGAVFVARKERFNDTVAASMDFVRSVKVGTMSPQLYALMMRAYTDENAVNGTRQLTYIHNVPSQVCLKYGLVRGRDWTRQK